MLNYAKMLDTFLFRRSWGEVFKALTDEEAGKLIKAVYLFTEGEETLLQEPALQREYSMICKQLNQSSQKHTLKLATLRGAEE